MKLSELGTAVTKIQQVVDEVKSPTPRRLADMEGFVGPGSQAVAVLTVVARQQESALQPVMEALKVLENVNDWPQQYVVAGPGRSFDWKTSDCREYHSFADFYKRELEPAWGPWGKLQETYARFASGDLSEPQARDEIKERARKAAALAEQSQATQRAPGAPLGNQNAAKPREVANATDEAQEIAEQSQEGQQQRPETKVGASENDDNHCSRHGRNDSTYAERRLRKDRPDLHERVLAGELTWNAAMIEAGFRKKPARKRKQYVCPHCGCLMVRHGNTMGIGMNSRDKGKTR